MKKNKTAGFCRLLLALMATLFSPLVLGNVELAHALGWQWTALPGRERITLLLDSPGQASTAQRVGTTSIAIPLGAAATTFDRQGGAPAASALLANASLNGNQLLLNLASPAFGFIVTQPNPRSLVLDIYPDQLGARWKAPGVIAPAGSVGAQTPVTTPNATPATPTPPAAAVPPTATTPPAPAGVVSPPATNTTATAPVTTPALTPQTTAAAPINPPVVNPAASTPPATAPVQPETPRTALRPNQPQNQNLNTQAVEAPQTPTPAVTAPLNPAPGQPAAIQAAPTETPKTNAAVSPAPAGRKSKRNPAAATPGAAYTPPATIVFPPTGTGSKRTRTVTTPAAQPGPAYAAPATQSNPQVAKPSQPETLETGAVPLSVTPLAPPPGTTPSPFVVPPSNTVSIPTVPATPATPNTAVLEQNAPALVTGSLQSTTTASPETATNQTVTPQATTPVVRARLNDGPPEAWPAEQNLSSAAPLPSSPAPSAPAPSSPSNAPQPPLAGTNEPQPGTAPAEQVVPSAPESVAENAAVSTLEHPPLTNELEPTPAADTPSLNKPLENDFTTQPAVSPANDEKEPDKAAAPAENPNAPPIIYVDEQGNPTDPPPDIDQLTADMRKEILGGNYTAALPIMERLRKANITPEVREELLYNTMNSLFETNQPDFLDQSYDQVIRAANEALNYNTKSLRVPDAMLVLGKVNLAVGNIQDAEGYIKLLQRDYPQHQGVTGSLLALGEHYMDLMEYPKAVSLFQTILQDYPESAVGKDAARLQAMALYRQGHFDRALTLLDFVDRRWPRVHLEDPEYLLMAGDVQYQQARLEDALKTYWLQYNLQPTAPTTPFTLMRIATIYLMLKENSLAHEVMAELTTKFPTSPEAPLAHLYTGENGIYEGNPSLDELFAIFEAPNPRIPELSYNKILADYPNSPQALTAALRKVAWQLWSRNHTEAMHSAVAFMDAHPDKPEYNQAKEILLRTFAQELGVATAEENFERVLTLWESFPQVHDYYKPLENELRVALARAQLNRGNEKEGLELLAPFLEGPEDPLYGLYTYNLYLAALMRDENWSGILNLGDKVSTWKLPKEVQELLDYSMAMAAENTDLSSRALPLWKKLAPNTSIPLYQRTYAAYFLARDAERRQDLRDTYQYNLDALAMFRQLEEEQSPYAAPDRVRETIAALMDVTEVAGRIAESLEWANQYALFVPDTSPDYAGLRYREARLHRKMGDMARWRALLEGIISREPDSVFGKMAASELRTQEVARDLARFTTE